MTYYTCIIFLEAFAALIMATMVLRNPVIEKRIRMDYLMCFIVLDIIVITEWLNFFLNGKSEATRILHYAVKCTEFCFIPLLPAIATLAFSHGKYKKVLVYANLVHWVFEIVSCFTGFVFYMDASNSYHRADLYIIFVAFYSLESVLLLYELVQYGKPFQNNNYVTISFGVVFLISGIGLQILDTNIKTSWLTVELALIISYIYVNDMALQTDKLTGLLNRWCYERHIESVNFNTAVCIFDVNNFKSVNDTYGHLVGDECLKKSAELIRKTFAKDAKCYRIGGDEFCVIFKRIKQSSVNEKKVKSLIKHFNSDVLKAHEEDSCFTGISVGYGIVKKGKRITDALDAADKMMYKTKHK